ncbi:MAG: hypothetical protein JXB49_01790 [Bacteroidales bacterium]|nr:hypothetical protein [Bacteroidales bacterium]
MKTIGLFIISFAISVPTWSQSAYENAMQAGLDSLHNIKSLDDFQSVANHFERIAKQEPKQWLPSYYAAYCYIILSFKQKDMTKKQSFIDVAGELIEISLKLAPNESELFVLKGMYYQAIIALDPATNGQSYSQLASETLQTALQYNPDNPRAYYLMAYNTMYTPEQYGGGMKAACPSFQKAKELYTKETENDDFMPTWGKDEVTSMADKCSDN